MKRLHSFTFDEWYKNWLSGGVNCTEDVVEITQEMNDTFKKLIRSRVQLHENENEAQKLGYQTNISYGLLYEVISVAAGEALTGENAVGYEWNVLFRKPIFVGDQLRVKCEVERVIRATKTVIQKITVFDSDCIRSSIRVKIKFLK